MTDQHDKAARESYVRTGTAVAKAVARLKKKGLPPREMGAELIVNGLVHLTGLSYVEARSQMLDYAEKVLAAVAENKLEPVVVDFADALREVHIARAAFTLSKLDQATERPGGAPVH